jgi:hypothetical protein
VSSPGFDEGDPSGSDDGSGERGGVFPTFACTLGPPKVAARTLVRALFLMALTLLALALWAHDSGLVRTSELAALAAGVVLTAGLPARKLASRLAGFPDRCPLVFDRSGFRLPWLDASAPGPEGPWEALRGFHVRRGPGHGRVLVLEVASGRLPISDRSIGSAAFDAALAVLERALGPEGVLLGSVVRLPIRAPDPRSVWARIRPALPSAGLALAFSCLAIFANTLGVRILAGAAALAWIVLHLLRGLARPATADLALGLDGLVAPLPDDPRRAVKVPWNAVRRSAVEEAAPARYVLVIEHDRGRFAYPLEWLDPRHARTFARALAERREPGD